ncbi:hypothetical protein AB0C52_31475 [Streptomyces sp. NPDC048717]|uniref:hypothetical protein n=1 Tax=Streptomyces sp. NPDC048717 TaxID=3154928 RepID=UPI003434534A
MAFHTPYRPLDVTVPFPELIPWARTGTRLHPRPGAPTARESSVGGPLLWPAGETWPGCAEHGRVSGISPDRVRRHRRILREVRQRPRTEDGRPAYTAEERAELDELARTEGRPDRRDGGPLPLLALAQLYVRDVPDLAPFAPPGTDLLQVLWCPFYEHEDGPFAHWCPYTRLFWRRAADVTDPLAVMPEPGVVGREYYVPEPCVLHPEQVIEYPYADYLPAGLVARIDAWEDELRERMGDLTPGYQYDLSLAPGWKAGGWESWHRTDLVRVFCDACGTEMRVLLTIDTYEKNRPDCSWEPFDLPFDLLSGATGIKVGRDGEYRAFVCPADPAHPHRMRLQ